MAKLLKLRRGTTTQHGSFTGAEGEVTIDTTKDTAVVHCGSVAGGHPLAKENLANVSSSTIAGRLDNDSIAPAKIGAGTLPSDVTVASANLVDGTIVNADINASAAIANSKLADSGVTAGTVGSSTAIPIVTVNSKGIITGTSTTAVDSTKINTGTTEVGTASSHVSIKIGGTEKVAVESGTTTFSNNIAVSGTVDGRDVAADGSKLDGIETGATGDQTSAEIKTLLASNKLTSSHLGVDSVTDSQLANNAVDTNAIQDEAVSFAKMQHIGTDSFLGRDSSGVGDVENLSASAARTILNVEDGATADQTASEIRTLVESASDSNVFTDADHSKLNGIATGATNVTNNNQLTNGAGYITASSNINASNLSSGTIPDARFPSTLPAINGSNLTGLAAFPSGTKMIFNQASAPTGWTKVTSGVDNKALRVVSGSGGGTGGSVGFTTAFASKSLSATASSENTGGTVASHTLTENEIPSHNHVLRLFKHQCSPNLGYAGGWQGISWYARSFCGAYQDAAVTSTGGGAGHTHGFTGGAHNHTISVSNVDLAVSYIDVIVAQKD